MPKQPIQVNKNEGKTPKILFRPCPVCGHVIGDVIYSARFCLMEGSTLPDHYDVVLCKKCLFAFADSPSRQEDYDLYYSVYSAYEDAATATGSGSSVADAARLKEQARHIAFFMPSLTACIADIGCANGGLLDALKTLGYANLTGIDPSPNCVRNLRAKGINAYQGILSTLHSFDKTFDMILLTGVLEHVLDVSGAIRSLDTLLAPEGMIYISVPDASRYCDFIYAPFQDFSLEHINHFTVCSLTNLMRLKGYEVIAAGQRTESAPPDLDSPSAWGLFKRSSASQALAVDTTLESALMRYIITSQDSMDHLAIQLKAAFEQYAKIIVWGTGQLALKLLTLPETKHTKIAAFVDGNPINQGRKLLEKTILSPQELKYMHMQQPILITTTLHHKVIEDIIRNKLGLNNKIIVLHG